MNVEINLRVVSVTMFDGDGDTTKTFTQEDVNGFIAKEKEKFQGKFADLEREIQNLTSRSNLSAKENEELNGRLETIRNESLTKEQELKKALDKAQKDSKKTIDELTADRDNWQNLYHNSTITNSLISAAAKHEAYNNDQILAILKPTTKLVQELDAEGKSTGRFTTKVSIITTDDKGKSITLEMDPDAAVKHLKESDTHANLFKGTGVSGLSRRQGGSGRDTSPAALAKSDPVAYARARLKGEIKL